MRLIKYLHSINSRNLRKICWLKKEGNHFREREKFTVNELSHSIAIGTMCALSNDRKIIFTIQHHLFWYNFSAALFSQSSQQKHNIFPLPDVTVKKLSQINFYVFLPGRGWKNAYFSEMKTLCKASGVKNVKYAIWLSFYLFLTFYSWLLQNLQQNWVEKCFPMDKKFLGNTKTGKRRPKCWTLRFGRRMTSWLTLINL